MTDLSSTVLSQASDSQYERHLRILQQAQSKRANFLEKFQNQNKYTCLSQTSGNVKESDKETLKEVAFGPYKILAPARYFTPVKKNQKNDVTAGCEEKSNTVSAGEESPVRIPGRKICHSVPPALRTPHGRKPNVNASLSQPLPKKRQCISTPEDVAPPRKVGKRSLSDVQANIGQAFTYREPPLFVAERVPGIPVINMAEMTNTGQTGFKNITQNQHSLDVRNDIGTDSESKEAKVDTSIITMEEYGRYNLDGEVPPGHRMENRKPASEEEQFAETLEAFLKKHDYLPREIKEELVSMLVHTKTTVAREVVDFGTIKDDVIDLTIDQSDEELGLVELRRLADNEVSQTDLDESFRDTLAQYIEDDQNTQAVLQDTIACKASRYPKIRDVEVKMDNSGEIVFNEIAGFFGYDGYVDYLTYKDPEETETIEQDGEYAIDNEALLFD